MTKSSLISVDDRRTGTTVYAIVDAADVALVAGRRWRLHRGYAFVNAQHPTKRRHRPGKGWAPQATMIGMHQVILGIALGARVEVRRKNGNRLDNRRRNLRVVARASQHRGVCWDASMKKWRAIVQLAGTQHRLGTFSEEHQAVEAVRQWRAEHAGACEGKRQCVRTN